MKQRTVTETRFGEYQEDDRSVTLRSKSATCGGGSEVLVIEVFSDCCGLIQSHDNRREDNGDNRVKGR